MTTFSANLGFLWTELTLPDAIRAAKASGFSAVECHWPYETPAEAVRAALNETGLEMLGLNTVRGQPGENGLAALAGREDEARAAIDQAIDYARSIRCRAVHVMAGFAEGPDADKTFLANLTYACEAAPELTFLIEPLNRYDAPGYFLATSRQARSVIERAAQPNLRLMFDCYHLQIMEGDLSRLLQDMLPITGHIQFASVPDRGTPDHGELDYAHVFGVIRELGYEAPLGAEYKPDGPTEDSLGWMSMGDRS